MLSGCFHDNCVAEVCKWTLADAEVIIGISCSFQHEPMQ